MRSFIAKKLSVAVALALVVSNLFAVSVSAAAPVITVKNRETGTSVASTDSTATTAGKKSVSGLRIVNLEQPRYGDVLDRVATVMTNEGFFWEIPVIWVDENGQISMVFMPGKKYTPVFTFFIPTGVTVENDEGLDGYQIKLPEFLDGLMSSDELVMVADPSRNITFITSTQIVDSIAPATQETGTFSLFVNAGTVIQFLSDVRNTQAYDYASFEEKEEAQGQAWNAPETAQENADAQSQGQESSTSEASQGGEIPGGGVVIDELVKIHCSDKVIDKLGNDNLKYLLDLIINVIEPQAVFSLVSAFPSYSAAAADTADEDKADPIGKNIGLYVYSHTSTDNPKEDIDALAFVDGNYESTTSDVYKYYIGVDTDRVFTYNTETNAYEIQEEDMITLNNTLVHEMMHAFMDDYNRTGMTGDVPSGSAITYEQNKFPNWFVEGSATCVDDVYEYRSGRFDEMRYGSTEEEYTVEGVIEYYRSKHSDEYGEESPWLDFVPVSEEDGNNNERRDYVNGYLACIYLSSLALQYLARRDDLGEHESLIVFDEATNKDIYNNKGLLEGFDYILNSLHSGTPMDEVVSTISSGRYTDVSDFEKKFIQSEDGTRDDSSLDFVVSYLNCLDSISKDLAAAGGTRRANGNILLPLNSSESSTIKGKDDMPYMGDQSLFVISPTKSAVASTADVDIVDATAGVKTAAYIPGTDLPDNHVVDDISIAAKAGASGEEAEADAPKGDELADGQVAADAVNPEDAQVASDTVSPEDAQVEDTAKTGEGVADEQAVDAVQGGTEGAQGDDQTDGEPRVDGENADQETDAAVADATETAGTVQDPAAVETATASVPAEDALVPEPIVDPEPAAEPQGSDDDSSQGSDDEGSHEDADVPDQDDSAGVNSDSGADGNE
ncbi:hypothetical protein [Butyrivibrio sp. AE2032]|uniref:hypothetical protein n=1 Tax=Butyrivibrio sp. AE2032 TaxID=1458463 RepID=UPI000550242E|nr:hypothetical protein [Butyrivibrio sp. AE2032]